MGSNPYIFNQVFKGNGFSFLVGVLKKKSTEKDQSDKKNSPNLKKLIFWIRFHYFRSQSLFISHGKLQVYMGRTLQPFRRALEEELATWDEFKKTLGDKDQEIVDQLMNYARQHADAGSMAGRSSISEIIFISIAIEQQKMILRLQEKLEKNDLCLHTEKNLFGK